MPSNNLPLPEFREGRTPEEVKLSRLLTWKQADKNLCRLAAYLVAQARERLRSGEEAEPEESAYASRDGKTVPPDFPMCEDNQSILGRAPKFADETLDRQQKTASCYYGYICIVKQNLKLARRALKESLYPQSRRPTKQASYSRKKKSTSS